MAFSRRGLQHAGLWRGNQLVPSGRSFSDIVKGARDPSSCAPGDAGHRLTVETGGRAAAFSLPGPIALCAAIALIGVGAAAYCALGYIHYKEVAGLERASAERTARANADLQAALERLRDHLGAAAAGIDPIEAAKPTIAGAELDRTDRVLSLSRPFGSLDRDLARDLASTLSTSLAATLADPPVKLANGHLLQAWVQVGLGSSEEGLQRLSAEYDAIVDERDRLRQRVSDLEQQLSLLEPRPAPAQAAAARQDSTTGSSSAGGLAAIAFPGAAAAGPGAAPSPPILKNFVAPASAPNHFSNESGAILGAPSPASVQEKP